MTARVDLFAEPPVFFVYAVAFFCGVWYNKSNKKSARGGHRFTESFLGKLIAKTAGITLACLIALILILFGVFTLFFPSVMLNIADFCGMEKLATQYAVSVYTRSNEIDDLADVVERAYYAQRWGTAADYGERLMARSDYEEFCGAKDESVTPGIDDYAQYIAGIVSVAQYHTGEGDEAIETAFAQNRTSFQENNSVVTLAMAAVQEGDKAFAGRVLEEMRTVGESVIFEGAEAENFEGLLTVLESFCAQ